MGAGKGEREVMVDRYCLNMLGEREVMVDRYCLNMLKQNGVPIDTGRNCYYLTKDCHPIPILTAAIKILHV